MPDLHELLPLLLAFLLGGAIGLEREWHGRPAGLRTHILVCMCSTMLILVSRSAGLSVDEDSLVSRVVFDPNRMGAGIVTGIGFLGAATVLRSGEFLRGLTTAACIWFVAGLGIVLGTERYALGAVATVLVLFVLVGINRLNHLIPTVLYRRLIVQADGAGSQELVATIRAELERRSMRVIDIASGHFEDRCELVFYLSMKQGHQAPALTAHIQGLAGVQQARWKQIA